MTGIIRFGTFELEPRVGILRKHGVRIRLLEQPLRVLLALLVYLVDAAGGSIRPACPKECRSLDFAWKPDGKKIAYGAPGSVLYTRTDFYLRLLDLESGEVTEFPGSEGFFSPRSSPDWSTLLAVDTSGLRSQPMLYRVSERQWKGLPNSGPGWADWPSWSRDGQSIWYFNFNLDSAITRCHVRDNRHEEVLRIKREEATGFIGLWFNLTPNDEPMILRRRDIPQIYALEWKAR